MIDNFAILLSTAMTVYVILRATKLNRTLPWFERTRPETEAPSPAGLARGANPAAPSRLAALQRALKH